MEHYVITTDKRTFAVYAENPNHLGLIIQQALAPGETMTGREYKGGVATFTHAELRTVVVYESLIWIGDNFCQIQYAKSGPVFLYLVICDPNF